jgi:RimJ/RimL family protein N-acetyltransferase
MVNVQFSLVTDRLIIEPLALADDQFILELVNTEGWLRFIGNRNITSDADARAYIQKIIENHDISYWVVSRSDDRAKAGVITYIKREYLDHRDIGFAFLPQFSKKGYAYEATIGVLKQLIRERNILHVLATTLPGNMESIKLLKKLGFEFEREIDVKTEKLLLYATSTCKFLQ